MDENLLVRIIVPTVDGKARLGTGYPVARDRILTARHVLAQPDRDENQPIQIQWQAADSVAMPPATANVLWQGGADLDAAVLETTFPKTVNSWGVLSEQKALLGSTWNSCGFAQAGKSEAGRKLIGMTGKILAVRENESRFEVSVECPPDRPQQWQGASGCPLFIQGGIHGVVVTSEENFSGKRLEATAVWRLLQVPAFRNAIGYDQSLIRINRLRSSITRKLKNSPRAMQALSAQFQVEIREDAPALWAEQLAGTLLSAQAQELIRHCERAHAWLWEQDDPASSWRDADTVLEVAHDALPAVFDRLAVATASQGRSNPQMIFVSLPVATRTVAEIAMAGADQRAARFEAASEVDPYPPGRYLLPMPPECGIDETGESFREAFHTHMLNKFPLPAEIRLSHPRDVLIRLVAQYLQDSSDRRHETYYFVLLPGKGPEQPVWQAVFEQLKRAYPALVFIRLSAASEQIPSELQMLYPLCDMLIRAVQARRER